MKTLGPGGGAGGGLAGVGGEAEELRVTLRQTEKCGAVLEK